MNNQTFAIVPYSLDGIGGECVAQNDTPFGMTDRQVGEALGYAEAAVSIQNVFMRNKDELSEEGLSVTIKLIATDGKRYNTRTWTKEGVVRLSFLSGTEKAQQVRSIAAKLFVAYSEGKLIGSNPNNRMGEARKVLKDSLSIMGMIGKVLGIDKTTQLLAATRKTREETGVDVMTEFQIMLPAPEKSETLLTATEIGKRLDQPASARTVNLLLHDMGMQFKIDGEWTGHPDHESQWFKKMVDGNGTRFQLVWRESVIPMIQTHLEVTA